MKDVFDFLRLDCAGDVINATFPYFDPKTMLNRALAIMRAIKNGAEIARRSDILRKAREMKREFYF